MALETGRAGKTDLDWLEHLAGTAKMELQYVFQPGSGVQAAVQGRCCWTRKIKVLQLVTMLPKTLCKRAL